MKEAGVIKGWEIDHCFKLRVTELLIDSIEFRSIVSDIE